MNKEVLEVVVSVIRDKEKCVRGAKREEGQV